MRIHYCWPVTADTKDPFSSIEKPQLGNFHGKSGKAFSWEPLWIWSDMYRGTGSTSYPHKGIIPWSLHLPNQWYFLKQNSFGVRRTTYQCFSVLSNLCWGTIIFTILLMLVSHMHHFNTMPCSLWWDWLSPSSCVPGTLQVLQMILFLRYFLFQCLHLKLYTLTKFWVNLAWENGVILPKIVDIPQMHTKENEE